MWLHTGLGRSVHPRIYGASARRAQQATEVEVCTDEVLFEWDDGPMGCLPGGRPPKQLKRGLGLLRTPVLTKIVKL